jgi:histone H3/H4
MTSKTLLKAREIYKDGGVERVAPTTYHVLSTSGETYAVELTLDRCSCATPKGMNCSHRAAVELARSARRKALVA